MAFLKEKYWIVELILAILIILILVLYVENDSELNDYKLKNDEDKVKIEELEGKVNSCNEQIKILGRNEKQQEIADKIKELQTKVDNLNDEKNNLEKQIDSLKVDIIRIKGEPKQYSAGYYTVGKDITAGRYKIYDGSSNFVVHSATGDLRVNTILGSNYGSDEYIYKFVTGDEVRAESSFKLVEIE